MLLFLAIRSLLLVFSRVQRTGCAEAKIFAVGLLVSLVIERTNAIKIGYQTIYHPKNNSLAHLSKIYFRGMIRIPHKIQKKIVNFIFQKLKNCVLLSKCGVEFV